MRYLKPPLSHKHRLVLASPLVACLAFGSLALLPEAVLTNAKPFSSALALAIALLFAGIVFAAGGCAFGVALALRRKQAGWLAISFACLLSVALLAFVGLRDLWY